MVQLRGRAPQDGNREDPEVRLTRTRAGHRPSIDLATGPNLNSVKLSQVDLIPLKLKGHVYLHEIDTRDGLLSCWSFVSEGLWAHRQKELQVTVQRAPGETTQDFPSSVLDFFKLVYAFAEKGQLVDVGGFTEFDPAVFLGDRSFGGLAYTTLQPLQGIDPSSPSLTAIFLTGQEMKVARAFGLTRVTANLGSAYGYYPFPPWTDRSRRSVVSIEAMIERSILGKMLSTRVRGVRARLEREQELILSVPRDGREELRARLVELVPTQPLALLTEVDPQANECLVWKPELEGRHAITPPDSDGSSVTGNFVAFVPEQRENDFRYIEDGFGVILTTDAWIAVRHALESESSLSLPLGDSRLKFSIEWIRTSYVSPTDSREYVADAWKTYEPGTPAENAPADAGPVVRKRIVLLTSDSELARRTSADDLAGYITVIQSVVVKQFASLPRQQGQDLAIDCQLEPDHNVTVRIATRPGMDHEVIRTLYDHLRALAAPEVKEGPVKFQVLYTIWGGTGAEFG